MKNIVLSRQEIVVFGTDDENFRATATITQIQRVIDSALASAGLDLSLNILMRNDAVDKLEFFPHLEDYSGSGVRVSATINTEIAPLLADPDFLKQWIKTWRPQLTSLYVR